MDYYEQKQKQNEEMAGYLTIFTLIFMALAIVWAMSELVKHFLRG